MKKYINKSDSLFFGVGIIISFANILLASNRVLSIFSILLQVCLLIYYIKKKQMYNYFIYYMLFVTISFEENYLFQNDWYGFLHFEVFGFNLAFIMFIPLFLYVFKKKGFVKEYIINKPNTFKVLRLLAIAYLSSCFFGLLNIIINNNNIRHLDGYLSSFLSLIYFYGFTLLLLFCIFFFVSMYDRKNESTKRNILIILIVISINIVFASIFKINGSYDVYRTLLIPAASFYIPFLFLVGFYSKKKIYKIISLISVVPLIFLNVYASSGKSLIILLFIPIILFFRYISKCSNKKSKIFILLFICILLIGFFAIFIGIDTGSKSNIFQEKVNQILSIFDFTNSNYLVNVSASPRCRILEFINIFYEYIKTPFQMLFGKGFLGSFKDYTGLLYGIGNAFTDAQWSAGLFYLPHETVSRLLLFNGIFGIYVIYCISRIFFKSFLQNCWFLIGFLWFLFFYGYSFNLSIIGCCFFIIGLIDYDKSLEFQSDVLVMDFMFEFGHKTYCNNFSKALNLCASTTFFDNNNYYDFVEDLNHKKRSVKIKKVPSSNPITTRINLIYNIKSQLNYVYRYKFSKVIISSYEGLTLFCFLPTLLTMEKVYLFHHHQLDELDSSKLKKFIFNLYKNKVSHIVVDDSIKQSLCLEYDIQERNVFVFGIPLLNTKENQKGDISKKLFIALSNSNDSEFAKKILEYESTNKFFSNRNIDMVIRTKYQINNTDNLTFIDYYLSDEEYNDYYMKSDVVIIPFPINFNKRGSASIIDAMSLQKKVISSAIPFSIKYSQQYPKSCMVFQNFDEFINLINILDYQFDIDEYNLFLNNHNFEFNLEQAKKIISN